MCLNKTYFVSRTLIKPWHCNQFSVNSDLEKVQVCNSFKITNFQLLTPKLSMYGLTDSLKWFCIRKRDIRISFANSVPGIYKKSN